MEQHDSPYVWRDEPAALPDQATSNQDTVIVDGQAMSYREYRERLREDDQQ
jgi:hypothetical protein